MTGWDWLGLIGCLMVGGSILIAILAVGSAIVRDVRVITETRARLRRPTPIAEPVDLDDVYAVLHPHERHRDLRLINGGRRDPHGGAA